MPPVMILCGGKGTRLRDVTELLPKPMVPIGEQPILWHIMKSYAAFGCKRFILCLGYKREAFVDFFMNYHLRTSDATITLGHSPKIKFHEKVPEGDWEVTLAGTGLETGTGGRVFQAARYLKPTDREFFLTYGDGVADIDVPQLVDFHRKAGKMVTITSVHPSGRFGILDIQDDGAITSFREKRKEEGGWINAGFMVVEPDIFDFIDGDNVVLERYPLEEISRRGQLNGYKHHGFWQCMDTMREKALLEELWESGKAPWKIWD